MDKSETMVRCYRIFVTTVNLLRAAEDAVPKYGVGILPITRLWTRNHTHSRIMTMGLMLCN